MLVGYKDIRHSMYIHLLWLLLIKPNDALTTVLNYISSLGWNKPASFGFTRDGKHLMKASRTHPKVHLALRYVLRNYFHIPRVTAVRLGRGVRRLHDFGTAERSVLVHFQPGPTPRFHYYHSKETQLTLPDILYSTDSSIIQCIIGTKYHVTFENEN